MLIKMEDILIWNGTIWTLDDPEIICNGWLTAAGGVITAVGQGEPPVYLQAETVIDAKGHITPELEHRKSGYVERKRRPYQGNVVRIA